MTVLCEELDNLGADGAEVRLGIMGGTFDPIHLGHLRIAEEMREALALDAVAFMPAGNPVFKRDQHVTDAHVRFEQVKAAIADNPHFFATAIEVERDGGTYTVETLRTLRAHFPENVQFYFILGSDAAASIGKWRGSAEIAELAHLAVAVGRPGSASAEELHEAILAAAPFDLHIVRTSILEISSHDIRERLAQGRSVRYFLPDAIAEDYIRSAKPGMPLRGDPSPSAQDDKRDAGLAPSARDGKLEAGLAPSIQDGKLEAGLAPSAWDDKLEAGLAPSARDDKLEAGLAPSARDDKLEAGLAPSARDGRAAPEAQGDARNAALAPDEAACAQALAGERPATDADPLSKEFFKARKAELKGRVGSKRFEHSLNVSDTCVKLAKMYGVDVKKARIAGLLHDWDKGMDDDQARERVRELGMEGEIDPYVVERMPRVLHGITAAKALGRDFPALPPDVLQAISRHTTAALEMSDLDKVLYIADAIEPGRQFGRIDELRAAAGNATLDELYYQTYEYWVFLLFERRKALHPDTIRIWNAYAEKIEQEKSARRDGSRSNSKGKR